MGRASTSLCLRMQREEEVYATCTLVDVFMDPATRASCPIPASIRLALTV